MRLKSSGPLYAAALAGLLVSVAAVTPARAQIIATTFGPGDSYDASYGWSVANFQSIAQSFFFSGPGGLGLSQIRMALFGATDPYTVSFRQGTDMNSAATLESWSQSVSVGGIYTMLSVGMPGLTPGDTYWVVAENGGPDGAWYVNDQGYNGLGFSFPPAPSWYTDGVDASSAYDVTAGSVAPEPASLLLLASGLAGIAGVVRRRRRASIDS